MRHTIFIEKSTLSRCLCLLLKKSATPQTLDIQGKTEDCDDCAVIIYKVNYNNKYVDNCF